MLARYRGPSISFTKPQALKYYSYLNSMLR